MTGYHIATTQNGRAATEVTTPPVGPQRASAASLMENTLVFQRAQPTPEMIARAERVIDAVKLCWVVTAIYGRLPRRNIPARFRQAEGLPDGITRCVGCGGDEMTLNARGMCTECAS